MRLRFTLLFLLLVAVPLALMAWIGLILLRQQQDRAREAWLAVIEEKLSSADALLSQEMTRLESDFDALLRATAPDARSLHDLPFSQPLVRHAFLLDARGKLIFPKPAEATQGETPGFLRRTEAVWESGVRFGSAAVLAKKETPMMPSQAPAKVAQSAPDPALQRQATFNTKADVRPNLKPQAKATEPGPPIASGWHVWFYGNGPQMIFWQERADKRVAGVEVEMAALLSVLTNRLSSDEAPTAPGLLQLTSVDGKTVLHQWGGAGEEEVAAPVAHRDCAPPLGMWRLAYRPANAEAPRAQPGPVLLGLGGAGLALLAVAVLFLLESTRETREARRRVSFVNQVSHELKTPLTNIRLYAEMAQQRAAETGDTTAARQLEVVEAETSRLGRLIHNVLTFARQQRDQLTIHPRAASLDDVTQRVAGLWRPGLEAKGFNVECSLAAPAPFLFDPDAVEQVLGNLLSNVEKYAGAGRFVRIATELRGREARLMVEDRGPGIPAGMRERIFAPFVRVRNDLTEGVSGTGIGLAISRQLAELHGGALTLDDGAAGGARFVLTLPLHQP